MTRAVLIILTVIFLLPNFFNTAIFQETAYNSSEEFDTALTYIRSVKMLENHLDSQLVNKKIAPGSFESVLELSNLIRKRFYHGYSHFTLNQNWIAAVAGKMIDSGMACKVQPDKILQHPNAACSQQAIVMMAVLRNKGIPYRHLGFPHHYALEAFIDSSWYFFDPNMEPSMTKEQRSSVNWQYHSDSLKQYYPNHDPSVVAFIFGDELKPVPGPVNEVPATNASLFQTTTGWLSKTLWLLPLLLIWYDYRKPTKKAPGSSPG